MIENDGGFKSRKLWLVLFAMALNFGSFILLGKFPAIAAEYSTLVSSVVALVAVYTGGNAATKHITGKHIVEKMAQTKPEAEAEAEDKAKE
jgi:hypothetical protein